MGTAYLNAKPIVAVRGSGGVADEYAGKFIDSRRIVKIESSDSAEDSVEAALRLILSTGPHG